MVRLYDLENNFVNLRRGCLELHSDDVRLEANLDLANTEITALQTHNTTLQTENAALKAQMVSMEGKMSALEADSTC